MANFSALKTAIQNAIKQNGNEEITGDVLQQILLSIVSTMGDGAINTIEQNLSNETTTRQGADTQLQNAINAIKANIDNGYVYAGIATPSTVPVSGKVFYISTTAGTYTNFGGQVLTQGINILRFNGSAWSNQQLIGIDDVPIPASNSLIKSGGVQNELALGAVYDVSAKNPTGGPNNDGKWESLSALLSDANLNTLIPTAYRKGGMSIKFVQSSDNNYVQYRCIADEFTTDVTKWAIDDVGIYIENPEFIYVKTDAENKILWAIRTDGGIYYGAGVPQQVIDYINEKIAELSLDEYEDMVAFLNGLESGEKTLSQLLAEKADVETVIAALATKVDKVEGKSLIDEDVAAGVHYIENPEFINVELDANNKIIKATKDDGKEYFGVGIEIAEATVEYSIDEPEFIGLFLDGKNRIIMAFQNDGNVYYGAGVPRQIKNYVDDAVSNLNGDISAIQTFIAGFDGGTSLLEYLNDTYGEYIENSEYISIETDAAGKILGGRKSDGTVVENMPQENPVTIENYIDNPEWVNVEIEKSGKIVKGRDKNGVLKELVGIETNNLKTKSLNAEYFTLPQNTKEEVVKLSEESKVYEKYTLPNFGSVDILSETFYLTAEWWSSYQNDVELRQDYPDTDENAWNKVTLSNFYIKGTNTKLDFYAATKVTKVGNNYYVTDTLTEIEDPETHEISYEVNSESIEVRQCVDVPPISAWPVDKSTKHQCVITVDFGDYLNGTFYVLVSFQGSSTLNYRKRNFRFTFYKNNKYAKKLKLKIGELPRQSGYNLKANWTDNSRIKELSMYRLLLSIWKEKPLYKQFPWSNNEDVTPYYGATGFIQGFNVEVNVGGNFYGLYAYELKKDSGNYMIEDDTDGIFVCAESGHWSTANASSWENEIENEMPQDTADALNDFFAFLRSGNVTRETAPQRMDILPWLDYYICLQVFYMPDNIGRNMVLYSDKNKYKFTPFFYDLDLSLNFTDYEVDFYTAPWPDGTFEKDFLPYDLIKDLYWDEILGRYKELRKTVLSDSNIEYVFNTVLNSIPNEVINSETSKWGVTNIVINKQKLVKKLIKRVNWLDYNIFNN